MRESFDAGDLEKVARSLYDKMLAEAEEAGYPRPPWNRSRLVMEAVNAVQFAEKK